MKKFYMIIFFAILLYSCDGKKELTKHADLKKQEKETLESSNTLKAKNEFNPEHKSSDISNENYRLVIDSYFIQDKIDSSNILMPHVVLNQELNFFLRDSLLKKIKYPVRILDVKTVKNGRMRVQENNIYEISVIEGKNGWFYKISGAGILTTQSEFYGAYSPMGNLLWKSYATYRNINGKYKDDPSEEYGDFDELLRKYKINEENFNRPQKIKSVLF